MSLKMFTFYVQNDRTNEIASFKGQGATMEAAWKEGVDEVKSKFRGDSNGGGTPRTMAVRLPDGRNVNRTRDDFEGDDPYEDGAK